MFLQTGFIQFFHIMSHTEQSEHNGALSDFVWDDITLVLKCKHALVGSP